MIERLDNSTLKKLCKLTSLSPDDIEIYLSLRHKPFINSSDVLASIVQNIWDEDTRRGIVVRRFYNGDSYIKLLSKVYEVVGDSHYQSRYIKFITDCPYHAYCTLTGKINTKPDWLFDGFAELIFPNPFTVFGSQAKCCSCDLTCGGCGKNESTINRNFVVHHRSYKYEPYSVDNWYEYYGILCRSCNNKPENQIREKEESEPREPTDYEKIVEYFKKPYGEITDEDRKDIIDKS